MQSRLLVTGSAGVIGRALCTELRAAGYEVQGFDLQAEGREQGDLLDPAGLARAVGACQGIIHLAAVSRVSWAEQDPERCQSVNVTGLQSLISAALAGRHKPWLLFPSSREVYGQAAALPVPEDAPLRPINAYGRSKLQGEALVEGAEGLRSAIIRLTNVYGCPWDHKERIIPAFLRAAARGDTLRLDGPDRTFDFVHVQDVLRAMLALVRRLEQSGDVAEPMQIASGAAVRMQELADVVLRVTGSRSGVRVAAPPPFDVLGFQGAPSRAREQLGWEPHVVFAEGIEGLASA